MDARCIQCDYKAIFDIEKNKIICNKCNIEVDYEEYIEIMREKALSLSDNFQINWDKRGGF